MGLLHVVFLAVLCGSAIADVVKLEPCSDDTSVCQVSEVRISPCRNGNPVLKKGRKASLSFDFTPSFEAQKLKTTVFWANGAVDVPFAGFGSDDACLYTSCPTQASKQQTLNYDLKIGKKLPSGGYRIKWKIWNEENESQHCCFMTNIRLIK